jgi:hypothetical protein
MDEPKLDQMLRAASNHAPEYLYYLLGSQLLGGNFQVQSAGDVAERGKSFFQKWREEFRKLICSKGGVYEQFVKGTITAKDLPKLVAVAILAGSATIGGVVISELIAVYLSVLVVQAGIAAFCDGYNEG